MKHVLLVALMAGGLNYLSNAQNGVAINSTGDNPHASSMLDVSSSSHGVLIPRLSETEKNAIDGPATGLMIFQHDADAGFWFYTGSAWMRVGDNLGNHTATQNLNMDHNKITSVALCTDNLDAANKQYVDTAVSASGGSGGCVSKPEMISEESSPLSYPDAIQYCETLSEGGFSDWRMPDANEIQFFTKMPGATSDFLWTKSLSAPVDYATNQNFVTVRLADGKWRLGGVNRFYFPTRTVSGSKQARVERRLPLSLLSPPATFSYPLQWSGLSIVQAAGIPEVSDLSIIFLTTRSTTRL